MLKHKLYKNKGLRELLYAINLALLPSHVYTFKIGVYCDLLGIKGIIADYCQA